VLLPPLLRPPVREGGSGTRSVAPRTASPRGLPRHAACALVCGGRAHVEIVSMRRSARTSRSSACGGRPPRARRDRQHAEVRHSEVNSRRSVFCSGPLDLRAERLDTNLRRGCPSGAGCAFEVRDIGRPHRSKLAQHQRVDAALRFFRDGITASAPRRWMPATTVWLSYSLSAITTSAGTPLDAVSKPKVDRVPIAAECTSSCS
jgi:hypothetical protein